ncbi:hypothetical protein ACHQM5_013663 [Ranunculus cassubicifolius]
MDIALFSPSSLFAHDDDTSSSSGEENEEETQQISVERTHKFPGIDLIIQEFSFHQLNANLLWPGTFAFAEWLVQHQTCLQGRRIIELGSGTGALAVFLKQSFEVDITTSDFDDVEVEENIAHNCRINKISPILPHVRHSWGDKFPIGDPDWDLVIASDILLYVKEYPNLIKTLLFLLKSYKSKDKKADTRGDPGTCIGGSNVELPWPSFLMSWRRRIGKEEEALFFNGCENAGFVVQHLGSRVYCISLEKTVEEGKTS